MSRRSVPLVLAVVLAAVLAGCGITDPYRPPSHPATAKTSLSTTRPRPADAGDPPSERGGSIPAGQQARQHQLATDAGSPTPRAALERYARLYVTWQAPDLVAHQRQLAAISLGQARAQALQAAASATKDSELTQGHVANHGSVVAITPDTATAGDWVLVTREHTTGQGDYIGLPATLHVIYARLTHTPTGWIVIEWSPQT